MPFNNGTFERVHNWVEDKENNIDINAVRLDQEDDNFANGLSQTLLRNGSVALTGNLDLGNHKIANLANGTASTDAVNKSQLDTKQNTITGAASTVTTTNLSPNKVLISNSSGKIINDTRSVDDIINAATDSTKVVHIAGTETITGKKTFLGGYSQVNLKVNGTETNSYVDLTFLQNNDTRGTYFRFTNEGKLILTTTNNLTLTSGTNIYLNAPNGNITAKTPAADDSSTKIATTKWVNTTGNNVVHLTDNEIITGKKTFTSDIDLIDNTEDYYHLHVINKTVTKGTPPTNNNVGYDYLIRDLDNSNIAAVGGGYTIDGKILARMNAYIPTKKSDKYASLSIYNYFKTIDNVNTNLAEVKIETGTGILNYSKSYATNSSNELIVPTMGWVNNPNTSTNVVHRTGNEVIAGIKRFTNYVLLSTDTVERGKPMPSGNGNITGIGIRDKNIKLLASFLGGASQDTSGVGYTYSYMRAFNPNNDSDTDATYLTLHYKANGDKYATCPASDINSSIVTTVAKSKGQNGYFKLGNGLIIQWGYAKTSANTTQVKMPIAFTTTNYSVTISRYDKEWTSDGVIMQTNNYRTQYFDFTCNDPAIHWIAIGY